MSNLAVATAGSVLPTAPTVSPSPGGNGVNGNGANLTIVPMTVTVTPPGSNGSPVPSSAGGNGNDGNHGTASSNNNGSPLGTTLAVGAPVGSGNNTPTTPPLSPSLEVLTAALVAQAAPMIPLSPRGNPQPPPGIAIVGRSADPTNIEDLTDDFDFDEPPEPTEIKKPNDAHNHHTSPPVPLRGLALPPARTRNGTISLRDELRIDDGTTPSMSGKISNRTLGSSGSLNPLIAAQLNGEDLFDGHESPPDAPKPNTDPNDPSVRPPRGSRARKPGSGVLNANGSPLHPTAASLERKESTRKMVVPEEDDIAWPDDDEPDGDNGTAAMFAAAKQAASTTAPSTAAPAAPSDAKKAPETKVVEVKKPAADDDDDNMDWANDEPSDPKDIKLAFGGNDSKKPATNSVAAAFMDSPVSTSSAAAKSAPKKNAIDAAFADGGFEDWDAEIDAEEEAKVKQRQMEKVAAHRATLGPAALAAAIAASQAAAAAANGGMTNGSNGSLNIAIAEEGEVPDFGDEEDDEFFNGATAAPKAETKSSNIVRNALLFDSDDDNDPDTLSSEHKLMATLANPDRSSKKFNIVMYPEPSKLFSMKTDDGLKGYGEKQLESWLLHLTSKHHPLFVHNGKKPEGGWDSNELDGKEPLAVILSRVLQVMHRLYRCMTHSARDQAWGMARLTFEWLEAHMTDERVESIRDQTDVYRSVYFILYVAAKMWTTSKAKLFGSFIQSAKKVFKEFSTALELLEVAAVAHHDGTRANKLIRILCSLYKRNRALSTPTQIVNAMQALTDLNLYLTGFSPLTTGQLSESAEWDSEDDAFEWLERAWQGQSPTASDSPSETEILAWQLCGDPEKRIKLIEDLYMKLPETPAASFVKARTAYILGHYYCVNQGEGKVTPEANSKQAEKYLFECLFILDKLQAFPNDMDAKRGIALLPIISELGTNALVLYGDILLSLSKYKYAILAYEAGNTSHRYRTGVDFYALERRLCDICTKNEDFERSLKYHHRILTKSTEDGNLNMYVYIVQQMAKLHVLQGNFRKSEDVLRAALRFLRPFTEKAKVEGRSPSEANAALASSPFRSVPTTEFRAATLNVFLQLARLYLNGDRITSAIMVLEMLKKSELPRGKKSGVLFLLATAYMKRAQFLRAEELLKEMEESAKRWVDDDDEPNPRAKKKREAKSRGRSTSFNSTVLSPAVDADVVKSPDFLDLRAKNALWMGRFKEALQWVDKGLAGCAENNYSVRARFLFRRGTILQSVILMDMNVKSKSEEKKELNHTQPLYLPAIKACVDALNQAFTLFQKVDDTIRSTETICEMVELYSSVAFVNVALLGHKPSSMSDWIKSNLTGDRLAKINPKDPDSPFNVYLEQAREYALNAMDHASQSLKVILMLKCYLNLGEICYLLKKPELSLAYWTECKEAFFALFVNGNSSVLTNKTTPGFSRTVHSIWKRMVRLLMCYSPTVVNQTLRVLDAFMLYEMDMYALSESGFNKTLDEEGKAQRLPILPPSMIVMPPPTHVTVASSAPAKQPINIHKRPSLPATRFAGGASSLGPGTGTSPTDPNARRMSAAAASHSAAAAAAVAKGERSSSGSADGQPANSPGNWSSHRSAAYGAAAQSRIARSAAGSRAILGGHSQAAADREANRKAQCVSLAEKVCFALYEMDRQADQFSARKIDERALADSNHATLNKMLRTMDTLRQMSGNNRDGIIPVLPPTAAAAQAAAQAASATPSSTSSSSASGSLANHSSTAVTTTTNKKPSRRLSVWLTSPNSVADPLWGNLVYCIPMDNIICVYSPKGKMHMFRMFSGPNAQTVPTVPPHTVPTDEFMQSLLRDFFDTKPILPKTSQTHFPKINGFRASALSSTITKLYDDRWKLAKSRLTLREEEKQSEDTLVEVAVPGTGSNPNNGAVSPGGALMAVPPPSPIPTPTKVSGQSGGTELKESEYYYRAVADIVPCVDCGCEWLTEHAWAPGHCRNCFHNHRQVTPISVIASPRQSGFGAELNLDLPTTDGGSSGAPRTPLLDPLASPDRRGGRHDWKERGSRDRKDSRNGGQGSPATPSGTEYRRISVTDADALLPPALDLGMVREMFGCLDAQNMMTLLAALFCECRLVFTASSNYRLSAVINSLLRLMYPFQWQHMFIPLLSEDSVGLIKFDRPYIIGVNSCLNKLIMPMPSEVVHVDLDREMVQYRPGSFVQFPAKAKSRLSKAIRKFTAGLVFPPLNLAAAFQEAIEKKATHHRRHHSVSTAASSLSTIPSSPPSTSDHRTPTTPTPTTPGQPTSTRSSAPSILPPSAHSVLANTPHHHHNSSGSSNSGNTPPLTPTQPHSGATNATTSLSSSAPASLASAATPLAASSSTTTVPPLSLTVPNSPAAAPIGLTPLGPGPVSRFPHSQSTPQLGGRTSQGVTFAPGTYPATPSGADNLTDHILSNEKAFVGNGSGDATSALTGSGISATVGATGSLHPHAAAQVAVADNANKTEVLQQHMASMAALRLLRDSFVTVFVSLFYKYRLFWEKDSEGRAVFDGRGFMDHSKPEVQTFCGSMLIRTECFQHFINVRANMNGLSLRNYLFDALVDQKLRKKCSQFDDRQVAKDGETMLFARNDGEWKKRWVAIEGDRLKIMPSRKSREVRYERQLLPSAYRVVVPIIEDPASQFTLSLVPTDDEVARALHAHEEAERKELTAHPNKKKKVKKFEPPEVFNFRCTLEETRKKFARLLRVRVLPDKLRERYMAYKI